MAKKVDSRIKPIVLIKICRSKKLKNCPLFFCEEVITDMTDSGDKQDADDDGEESEDGGHHQQRGEGAS